LGAENDAELAFRLQDSPVHLLRLALQRASELFAERVDAGELTLRQFMVLLAAHQRPGCTQTDLVAMTGIDRSTMGEMLDRMVRRGLLTRRRASHDQRANLIDLMDVGRQALAAAMPAVQAAQQNLLDALSPDLQQPFLEMLRRVAGAPEDAAGASAPHHPTPTAPAAG
jgi:MarR family transcriptional regulator, temperature-dependent positive regulator of motility